MRKLIVVLATILITVALGSCTPQKPAPKEPAFGEIAPAKLTEQEEEITALLAPGLQYSIFDFKIDGSVKSAQINRYRLENGQWTSIGSSGHTLDDTGGRVALISDGVAGQNRIVLQNGGDSVAIVYDAPEGASSEGMSNAVSYLSGEKSLMYGQEVPLQVQIFTRQSSFSAYDVDVAFSQPELYVQQGYEQVYTTTITFSQDTLS